MKLEDMVMETREDVRDVKIVVTSIDKSLALSLANQKIIEENHDILAEDHKALKVVVAKAQEDLNFAKASMKILAILGGLILFLKDILPFFKKML